MSDILGIDATGHIPGSAIKAAGYSFVGRYALQGAYRIDLVEVSDYHANGLAVEFFGEHESNFMLGGAPNGSIAGKDAHDYLTLLGAPNGTCVFYTCDFDAQPSQFPAIGAFLSAAGIEMGQYKAGLYGGISVVNAFPAYPSHQTQAWSGGEVSPHANFYQRVGTTLPPIAGTEPGGYDEDIAIAPVGLWEPSTPPPTPPAQVEDNGMLRVMTGADAHYFWNNGGTIFTRALVNGVYTPVKTLSTNGSKTDPSFDAWATAYGWIIQAPCADDSKTIEITAPTIAGFIAKEV